MPVEIKMFFGIAGVFLTAGIVFVMATNAVTNELQERRETLDTHIKATYAEYGIDPYQENSQ